MSKPQATELEEIKALISPGGSMITALQAKRDLIVASVDAIVGPQQVNVPLSAFTLADATPLAKFSDGVSSTPGLAVVGGKEMVIRWNNDATPTGILATIPLPADLDNSEDVIIEFMAAMSGATDHPGITTTAFFNAGDADCAGADPEITGAAVLTKYRCIIAAADVPAAPGNLTFGLKPVNAELGTDDLLIYSAWLSYTRKAA